MNNIFSAPSGDLAKAMRQAAERSVAPVWFAGATEHDMALLNRDTSEIPVSAAGRLLRSFLSNVIEDISKSNKIEPSQKKSLCTELLMDFDAPISQFEQSSHVGLTPIEIGILDAFATRSQQIRRTI